jgi:hypothetical protein
MPSCARDQPETVARGFRRADAPARCGSACFERLRRPDEKKWQACIARGEMQLLAGFQIEPVDHRGDRLRHARMQSFRHGPQRFFAMRRFDQSDARGIETEAIQAVSAQAAMLALPIGRQNEDEGAAPRQPRQNCRDETESSREDALGCGDDLVQGAAGQAALRQVGIESGQIERECAVDIVYPGQPPAQFLQNSGTCSRERFGVILRPRKLKAGSVHVGH